MMSPEAIAKRVRAMMSEERFRHTLGVKTVAARLAGLYGGDEAKASVAALLHDSARDLPLRRMQRLAAEADPGVTRRKEVYGNPLLLHGLAGGALARRVFHVRDGEVLRCIERHTTGGRGMSILEKIVFVADFIEPGRDFRGVETARSLARLSLDATLVHIYKTVMRLLLREGRYICSESLMGYNELILKIGRVERDGHKDERNQVSAG